LQKTEIEEIDNEEYFQMQIIHPQTSKSFEKFNKKSFADQKQYRDFYVHELFSDLIPFFMPIAYFTKIDKISEECPVA